MDQGNGRVGALDALDPISNGAQDLISLEQPYAVDVRIQGSSAMLFHRWDCEAIDEKAKAAKNSAAKKTDNVESYLYRCEDGTIGLPGEYLRQAIITAAKYRQDPRSPRKSAMDLFKAGVVSLTDLASLGLTQWDYLDRRRVMVQRNGITRTRPAFLPGWRAELVMQVLTPEYISPAFLLDVLTQAGRLIGVGDFRPTFGRFQVVHYELARD